MIARILLALMVVGATAFADDKPWAQGVSEAEQNAALALYHDGNAEFEESRYAQALAKYREALKHWDHPGIRFNMAVCLVNLDQPLDAYEHLEASLEYGEAPLGTEAYAQALTYKKLLLGQLAVAKITCDAQWQDASVTFDGHPLLTCPGEASRRVLPGTHTVVASKQGFMTEETPLELPSGKETPFVVTLKPIEVKTEVKTRVLKTKLVRRWNARTPWIVAGAGFGVAALGGIALIVSNSEYDSYDALLEAQCPMGCKGAAIPAATQAHEDAGARWNALGVTALAVGSAGIIAGLVGVYLNQPRTVVDESAPIVEPTATSTSAGASVRWRW